MVNKQIIYFEMDNVLANYSGSAEANGINPNEAKHVNGFFRNLKAVARKGHK